MVQSKKSKSPQISARKTSVFDDPPRKNVILLSCMDQRLLDETVEFMNALNLHNRYDQVALAGGAMGTLQLPAPEMPEEDRWQGVFQTHLAAAINLLHRPIQDVFLLDHLDCGAYKYLHPDHKIRTKYLNASLCEMIPLHQQELRCLAAELRQFIDYQRQLAQNEYKAAHDACDSHKNDKAKKEEENKCWNYVSELCKKKIEAWSNIRVSYFVIDLIGNVTQLDVPQGETDSFPARP